MANRPSQNHRKHLRQEERRLEYLDDPGGESRAWTAVNLIQFNKQKRDLKIENESLIIKLNYFLNLLTCSCAFVCSSVRICIPVFPWLIYFSSINRSTNRCWDGKPPSYKFHLVLFISEHVITIVFKQHFAEFCSYAFNVYEQNSAKECV